MEVTEREPTFTQEIVGDTLFISWKDNLSLTPTPFPETGSPPAGTIDQDDQHAANFLLDFESGEEGEPGFIIVDAPDFATRETIAKKKSGCLDGCETDYRYRIVRWPNQLKIPIAASGRQDIRKVVV